MAKKRKQAIQERALAHGLRYVSGAGRHFTGIPAQDLSPAQVAALRDADLVACLTSGLYEVAEPDAPAPQEDES